MDEKLIERLAREAASTEESIPRNATCYTFGPEAIRRFAVLIAEEAAKLAESFVPQDIDTTTWDELAAGRRSSVRGAGIPGAEFIANAIREKFARKA